jgi:PTH1 family peptidyl-tRNA hydrolase
VKLVVALGNPGDAYARTRHNVGWRVADHLAQQLGARFASEKFGAALAEGRAGDEPIWIMKPQSFMNHSGEAVGPAMKFWKLELEDLLVVHDDMELEPYRVQLKVGGGHGGHNGLRSVNAQVGSPDYARLRVGVGRPPAQVDPADYVLGRFPRAEEESVEGCVAWAAEATRLCCELGAVKAMNQVNRRREPA